MAATAGITEPSVNIDNNWWKHAVFYQIYPRSFMDSNGDGIGDLRGIISKLDHLVEMGVTATWLSPIFQSPMMDFGYDISDFKTIQSEYGNMQDFEDLIKEAKRLNIKIILDFVPNHTSDQCDWFQKSVRRVKGYEDFYVWADGKENEAGERIPPNNWQSVFYGSAWQWNEERQQYYLHQFVVQQPDLNYRNPKVIEAMDDILRFWLDKGVSGFRVDAVNHLFETVDLLDEPLTGQTNDTKSYEYTKHVYTKDLPEVLDVLHHWRQLLHDYTARNGGETRIMVTEAYADIKLLMDYYENAEGEKGAHFPFNFLFIDNLGRESDARDFVYNIQKWLTYMPRGHVANWVLGNHDNARLASRYGPERVDAMNILALMLPGVAVTYNGEEVGMQDYRDISWEETVDPRARNLNRLEYKQYSRDPERTPFQWDDSNNAGFSTAKRTWLPVHPNYKKLNLANQKSAPKSHFKVYQRLVQLRKIPTVRDGGFRVEVLNRNVFAFTRHLKGHPTVLVVINCSSKQQNVNVAELFDLSSKLQILVVGTASSHEIGHALNSTSLKIPPNECLVLQGRFTLADERRALIKTIIKSANIILVGLLVYKLWNNKWSKLNLNDDKIFLRESKKRLFIQRGLRF